MEKSINELWEMFCNVFQLNLPYNDKYFKGNNSLWHICRDGRYITFDIESAKKACILGLMNYYNNSSDWSEQTFNDVRKVCLNE